MPRIGDIIALRNDDLTAKVSAGKDGEDICLPTEGNNHRGSCVLDRGAERSDTMREPKGASV